MNQNKARILVADDNEVNQKLVQLILEKAGYDVGIVENGQQAVQTCHQNQYDLILMDIQMPIMDGHEATRKIRELEAGNGNAETGNRMPEDRRQNSEDGRTKAEDQLTAVGREPNTPSLPIIAMTGNALEGSFDENQYPGMNDCIGKPLRRDLIISVVQKWLGQKPASRTNENPGGESGSAALPAQENQFPLDLNRAIEEFMGKKEILYGVLHEFINRAKIRIDSIQQAVKSLDYRIIRSEAHGIKGGAANLTAVKLADLAADLEKAGQEQLPDLSAELADKLAQEFHNLEQFVHQNVRTPSATS